MKSLLIALILAAFSFPANAAISAIDNMWTVSSPDTPNTFISLFCQEGDMVEYLDTGDIWRQRDCAGTPYNEIYITAFSKTLFNKSSASAFSSTLFTGTTSQYVRGDGSLATLPSAGTRTFNNPSRTLNSCFQISSTQDAFFNYTVDVDTGLSLTSGAQGTVTLTSYTNSGCSTGAQAIKDGTSAQTGTLVVGLGINQKASVTISGFVPANRWVRISTANTVGTPTFTIRATQQEVLF